MSTFATEIDVLFMGNCNPRGKIDETVEFFLVSGIPDCAVTPLKGFVMYEGRHIVTLDPRCRNMIGNVVGEKTRFS